MNMIERVAKAIWEQECPENKTKYDSPNDKMVPCTWEQFKDKIIYINRAKAAIAAMREPTEEILAVRTSAIHYTTEEIWKMFIDAALKE